MEKKDEDLGKAMPRGARPSAPGWDASGHDQGHRPALDGGGPVRALEGWPSVKAMGRHGVMEKGDEAALCKFPWSKNGKNIPERCLMA